LPLPKKPLGRRQFLRLLATAGAAAVLPVPGVALGASRRPPLDFRFPQDPIDTWFAQTFGLAKADGRIHMGIDLMAPKMTPVYAIAEGTVNRIAQSPRAGRYMIIDHADGWQSWYLHLNNDDPGRNNGRADWALTVTDDLEEGSHVSAGRHIAFVGNSGNAEGGSSHTHFELHLGSRILNPYPYLVEGQAVALEAAHKQRLVDTVHTMCQPEGGAPAIDSEVCPHPTDHLPEIPKGVPGTF
jgi:murein DD-endopeptidase MepM/ murein hydrolase activator NlpD